jgi:hypothetical protein
MAKGVPSDLAVLESLGELMLKNDLAFRLASSLDFASFDLASLERDKLQRICFGLSKYDVQNPDFSQRLLGEITNRFIFPELPVVILKWPCFSSDQKVAAFELAYLPSNESSEFPFLGLMYGLDVLRALSPPHRDLASKVCRSMVINFDNISCIGELDRPKPGSKFYSRMISCIGELDRLKLDTEEGASFRRVLEDRIAQLQQKKK